MPATIVDGLEIIQVEVKHSKSFVPASKPRKRALKSFKKCQSIWQAGQLVTSNFPLNLSLFSNSLSGLCGMNEYTPPQYCNVAYHQDRHQQISSVTAAPDCNCRCYNDRRRERYRRNRMPAKAN